MVDLGAWFTEERVIPGPKDPAAEQWEEDESLSSFSPGDPSRHQ